MDPDVFITIAFCAEAALFAIGGGLVFRHEWRREALRVDAAQREFSGLSRSRGQARDRGEGADDRAVDDMRRYGRERGLAAVVDQHEARRLE
jgi:hypothetical protein